GAAAQIDVVEVQRQDLLLGEVALHLPGETDLGQLPSQRLLPGGQLLWEEVSRQLHGDRTATRTAPSPDEVVPHRRDEPYQVDALVLKESPVLDGHESQRNVVGQGRELDHLAPLAVEETEGRPFRIEHDRSFLGREGGNLIRRRAAAGTRLRPGS